jgi:hypothetical protein
MHDRRGIGLIDRYDVLISATYAARKEMGRADFGQ